MTNIALYPSVLAVPDPTLWGEKIQALNIPIAGIHYDVGDGVFVPSKMLPIENLSYLSNETNTLPIDVHLMVEKPSTYFPTILSFPTVKAVAFHVECQEDIHETIQALKNAGKKVGLALLDTTPADRLDMYLLEIDYIIVMTVKGGFSGTPFIPEVLPKISEIRHKNPDISIIVDGGIGEHTLQICLDAGATGAVMGSALFGGKDISWIEMCQDNK